MIVSNGETGSHTKLPQVVIIEPHDLEYSTDKALLGIDWRASSRRSENTLPF